MKRRIGLIFADYEEFEPSTYKGVGVAFHNEPEIAIRFNTGSYERDQEEAANYAKELGATEILCMSSIDHFYQDRD